MQLLEGNELGQLKKELSQMMPVDIADFFEELSDEKLLLVFRILPKDIAAEVFSYMTKEQQQHIIISISDREVRTLIDDLFLDDTVDFLEELPAGVVKKVLKNVDENERRLINDFLNYPPYTAGSIMTVEFVDLKLNATVKDAINVIRNTGPDKETVYTCYVIDSQRKLRGVVALRKLLLSDDSMTMEEIMDDRIVAVKTTDDQESVADTVKKYDLLSVPVVDNEDRLVGIVTVDDAIDVLEDENTEDIEIMAALAPSEEPYLKSSVFTLARNRIVWLLVLMISATVTSAIIKRFEDVLSTVMVLTAFIPMITDTGGNAGSQASVLVIRSLALGEIEMRDVLKVLWKEFRVSILCGFILGSVNFLKLILLDRLEVTIAFVVSFSVGITVIVAKIIGCTLPLGAKKVGLDPAIMASPLITTIVDALGLILYFSIASMILGLAV